MTYTLARLPIGISFLGHGLVRIPKLETFSEGISTAFSNSFLPLEAVQLFAFLLPFVEAIIGLGLLIGHKIELSCLVALGVICLLIFGSSSIENWSAVATQMFYGMYLVLLFHFSDYNKLLFKKESYGRSING